MKYKVGEGPKLGMVRWVARPTRLSELFRGKLKYSRSFCSLGRAR